MRNDVRALRENAGLSQAALGDALAVSRQTVNSIETGQIRPLSAARDRHRSHFATTIEEIFHVD